MRLFKRRELRLEFSLVVTLRRLELRLAFAHGGLKRLDLARDLRELHVSARHRLVQRDDLLLRLSHRDLHLAEEEERLLLRQIRLLLGVLSLSLRGGNLLIRGGELLLHALDLLGDIVRPHVVEVDVSAKLLHLGGELLRLAFARCRRSLSRSELRFERLLRRNRRLLLLQMQLRRRLHAQLLVFPFVFELCGEVRNLRLEVGASRLRLGERETRLGASPIRLRHRASGFHVVRLERLTSLPIGVRRRKRLVRGGELRLVTVELFASGGERVLGGFHAHVGVGIFRAERHLRLLNSLLCLHLNLQHASLELGDTFHVCRLFLRGGFFRLSGELRGPFAFEFDGVLCGGEILNQLRALQLLLRHPIGELLRARRRDALRLDRVSEAVFGLAGLGGVRRHLRLELAKPGFALRELARDFVSLRLGELGTLRRTLGGAKLPVHVSHHLLALAQGHLQATHALRLFLLRGHRLPKFGANLRELRVARVNILTHRRQRRARGPELLPQGRHLRASRRDLRFKSRAFTLSRLKGGD